MTNEEIAREITLLVGEYDFPLLVMEDVTRRLTDCQDPYYAAQQLRYLQNIVKAGLAKKKVNV